MEGGASVTSGGKTRELTAADSLAPGDKVRIGPGATLEMLRMDNPSNVATAFENTSFTVKQDAIHLHEGLLEARAVTGKPMKIRTLTVGASAETGRYTVRVEGESATVTSFGGSVQTTALDPTGASAGEPAVLTTGQRAEGSATGLGPLGRAPSAIKGAERKMLVNEAQKAYQIISSCRLEDNIGVCDEIEEAEMEYEDFEMFAGDEVMAPFRAAMPWPESVLEFSQTGQILRFEGPMILCVDYDKKNGKMLIKPFQSDIDLSAMHADGLSKFTWKSRNKTGLKDTKVMVQEGSVEVITPWLCDGCASTKKFLIEPGECFRFAFAGTDEIDDFSVPKELIRLPTEIDPDGSEHRR